MGHIPPIETEELVGNWGGGNDESGEGRCLSVAPVIFVLAGRWMSDSLERNFIGD